ncbi:hypothetical protein Glove_57g19 [Diversispora epigaea]|uniref:Uncharacterized protein n=1 Tax=Diversispora epigaea TaxID=1348612 RepID=A0A397JCE1_9GLOM|nr:hypothetical protein Glove_57g19 [Diversispora epigaea]
MPLTWCGIFLGCLDLESSNAKLTAQTKELEIFNTKLNDQKKELEASNYILVAQTKELEPYNIKPTSQNKTLKDQFGRMSTAHRELQRERKEFTHVLNKKLWNYCHDTGTLIRDLELLIPATSDRHNFISLTPTTVITLTTYAGQTPHAKYHTPQEAQEDGAANSPDLKPIENIWKSLKNWMQRRPTKY